MLGGKRACDIGRGPHLHLCSAQPVWSCGSPQAFCVPRLPQMASATDSRYGQKESSDQNFDYMFKILIIGNSSVGKTSFLFRYADDSFTPAFVSTVGIDFKVKTIYRNDKRIKLQIWVCRAGGEMSTPPQGLRHAGVLKSLTVVHKKRKLGS